jgi:uncharacterized sporulation protein YeaH/YhbH (DUF444 family)
MAIFREYDAGGRDRSAEDRRRHRQLLEEYIKKNLGSIIAEESIIGKSKDKTIKIPVRGIKEYQFIYGENHEQVAAGSGQEKPGDKITPAKGDHYQPGSGEGAGNTEGDDFYEIDVAQDFLLLSC